MFLDFVVFFIKRIICYFFFLNHTFFSFFFYFSYFSFFFSILHS